MQIFQRGSHNGVFAHATFKMLISVASLLVKKKKTCPGIVLLVLLIAIVIIQLKPCSCPLL
jgi:hypothetical protein